MRAPRSLRAAAFAVFVIALAGVGAIGHARPTPTASTSAKSMLLWAVGDGPNKHNTRARRWRP